MEDRVVAVRKRAEVESKHCLTIVLNNGTEQQKTFSKSVLFLHLYNFTLKNSELEFRIRI